MSNVLEEKDAIRELIARYCFLIDAAQYDEWAQTFDEERFILIMRAAGRDPRKMPRPSPDRHDDHAGAELAREIEQRGDIGPRRSDFLRIRVDEPAAVAAGDRGDRDLLAYRGASFIKRRLLRELERVETKAPRGFVLLRQRRSGHEAILDPDPRHDRTLTIVVFISSISTQA